MENNSNDSEKALLDVAPMRRFAMATGTVLWAYLVAGGVPAKEWKSTLIPLEITHPEFLVIFFLAVSVYASWRYWYFGVHLSLTRTKIRQYLKSSESMLVFSAGVQLQIPLISTRNPESQLQGVLRNKLLPGMQENEFLFFSDTNPGETQSDTVRFLVAHKLQKYFPGLQPDDITPRNAHTSTAN